MNGSAASQRDRLLDLTVDHVTRSLREELEEERRARGRVVELYLAKLDLLACNRDSKRARAPVLARYHAAFQAIRKGDLKP